MPAASIHHPASLSAKYTFHRELGQGAYGQVYSASCHASNLKVAIKKVTRIFDKQILTKRTLREIKILRFFNGHENITDLLDLHVEDINDFQEVYLIQDLMEADLYQIIRSEQSLTDPHFQYFIYQICRGVKYIHSANVLHRDLKPGNLLVNADCELKICDFGLARAYSHSDNGDTPPDINPMTEYVATRWYRAPEIMLSYKSYSKAIDLWSIGCIFAELIGGKPLFKGRDCMYTFKFLIKDVDQLNQILSTLGTPSDETLTRIASERAQAYIKSLPWMPVIPFSHLFPQANPLALDLLGKFLRFDPAERISVEDALAHPYLEAYHDIADEPSHMGKFDFAFESIDTIDEMRGLIVQELIDFANTKPKAIPESVIVGQVQ